MDFTVFWTEAAVADFERIIAYIGENSPQGAETVRSAILKRVELLKEFPEIGPGYEQDRSRRTREIVCSEYRIFYQVNDTNCRVEILTLWHGARREPHLPAHS